MNEYVQNLIDKKGRIYHEYRSIVETAAKAERDLTPDEQQTLEKMDADIRSIDAEQRRHEALVAEVDLADTVRAAVAPRVETSVKQSAPTDEQVLRAIALGDSKDGIFGMSTETRSRFAAAEQRALGNTYTGGSAVREVFADQLVAYERTLNPMMSIATVVETPNDGAFRIPRLTADQAYGGTVTAEGGGIVAADPTLSSVVLYTYKAASITLVSSELVRQNAINLETVIARHAGRELGIDVGAWLTTGTGSDQPNGFITAAATATATKAAPGTAGTFFSAGDLIDLYFSLAAPYRAVGVWQFEGSGLAKVRKLTDDNGNLLFNPDMTGIAGAPSGLLMGRPVYENPAMAAPASAVVGAAFGDFSAYWARRMPLRVDVSTDFKFQNDQVAIRTILEVDGDLVDVAAVKVLKCADA